MVTTYPSNKTVPGETRGGSRSARVVWKDPGTRQSGADRYRTRFPEPDYEGDRARRINVEPGYDANEVIRRHWPSNRVEGRRFARAIARVGIRQFGRKLTGPLDWFELGFTIGKAGRRAYDQATRKRQADHVADWEWFPLAIPGGSGSLFGNFGEQGWAADGVAPLLAPGVTFNYFPGSIPTTREEYGSFGRLNDAFNVYQNAVGGDGIA